MREEIIDTLIDMIIKNEKELEKLAEEIKNNPNLPEYLKTSLLEEGNLKDELNKLYRRRIKEIMLNANVTEEKAQEGVEEAYV